MTDAELAIKYLDELKEKYTDGEGFDRHPLPEYYAIEDGIEALHKVLEQEPCEDATLKDIFCMGCEYKEQEPCEDAVSRKDALGALEYELEITSDSGFEKYKPEIKQILNTIYDIQKKRIQALPSVTPTPKEDVLDKIREEIEKERVLCARGFERYYNEAIDDALSVIDRYKADKGVEE